MKKFLSINNSKGIYVASDETVIDFINKADDSVGGSASGDGDPSLPTIDSSPDLGALAAAEKTKRKNPVKKVLKVLHLKPRSLGKMEEKGKSTSSAAGSMQSLTVPKAARSRSRTAELVRKFSGNKKSAIPVRPASSIDSSSVSDNEAKATASTSRPRPSLKLSEMSLVNIDYRQESVSPGDSEVNVDVQVGRSQYRSFRSGSVSKVTTIKKTFEERATDGGGSANAANLARSSDQLQITITGSKRCKSSGELLERNVSPSGAKIDQPRPLAAKKLNICRGVALSTVASPPAPTPTYRVSPDGVIKNDAADCSGSLRESAMSTPPPASAKPTIVVAKVASFDSDEVERFSHSMTSDERRNSLMSELIEAEAREPPEPEAKLRAPADSAELSKSEVQLPRVVVDSAQAEAAAPPAIQFEVGKEVRPIITSNPNLFESLASIINDPTATFESLQRDRLAAAATDTESFADASVISVDSLVGGCSGADTNAEQPSNRDHGKHRRRRIAYVAQEPPADAEAPARSAVKSIEDSYCSDQFHLDSTLTQLTFLSSSNTEIKELLMPAYGDLVWDDDGVKKRQPFEETNRFKSQIIFSLEHFSLRSYKKIESRETKSGGRDKRVVFPRLCAF